MNPESQTPEAAKPLTSLLEAAQTICAISEEEAGEALGQAGEQAGALKKENVQAYDSRDPMNLSPGELHKLQLRQEEFVQSVATRLSVHQHLECSLKLTSVKTITHQKLAEGWHNPSHFTLFKMEPLHGVSILEISNELGLCMVDRLMGGPGQAPAKDQETSEIEKALLEQTVQLFLEEWCGQWSNVKELKPVILGYESDGRFIQSIPPETIMLVVSMQATFGECAGRIQMGFPYAAVDPLIRRVRQSVQTMANAPSSAPPPPATSWKWNPCFDDVCVPVTAEWEAVEMTTRQVLALKVGDVLPLDSRRAQPVKVRVADMLRFQGRPGTQAGQWAVELTRVINR